jgi:hypothetical protein
MCSYKLRFFKTQLDMINSLAVSLVIPTFKAKFTINKIAKLAEVER